MNMSRWADGFKKAVLVLAVAMLLGSAAGAAPADSTLASVKEKVPEYTKKIPGGLEITYKGLWKHGNILEAYYTVVAANGGRVSIEAVNSMLKDTNEVEISLRKVSSYDNNNVEAGAYINDEKKDSEDFVANQPYKVAIRYWVPDVCVLTPTYEIVSLIINGLLVEFKNVSAVL